MNVKVKEIRRWNRIYMMLFFAKNGWLGKPNMGCLYDNLFCFVEHNKPTNKNLYAVAKFVVDHCAENEDVEHIMRMILRQVVMTRFVIEKGE